MNDNEMARKAFECKDAVDEYMQGITKVKEQNATYRELQPDESVLEELRQKPLSWIGKSKATLKKGPSVPNLA